MTEVEVIIEEPKEEDDKDDDESIYTDPNGEINGKFYFSFFLNLLIFSGRHCLISRSIRRFGLRW